MLFGNVTQGMGYDIDIDGLVSSGIPSDQTLAAISGLSSGFHSVKLTAQPSQDSGGILVFESASVIVGTGLTEYYHISCCIAQLFDTKGQC